jgi:signal transduction histidine kinase
MSGERRDRRPSELHERTADTERFECPETRELVALVEAAAAEVRTRGEEAFADFRTPGSRWRQGESYVFVMDPEGDMRVHPDPKLEGENALELRDVNGKPIVQGLIRAATSAPAKPHGWYHYQWPVPGGLLPRWKTSFVRRVAAPSGRHHIVGCGMYNDRMERAFVTDLVKNAVAEIEAQGEAAFPLFEDPKGPFLVKDVYIFVIDMAGNELANGGFPSLVGRNMLDPPDARGTPVVREMLELVRTRGSGWVDYMWPKPGESVSTRKSAYVSKATFQGSPVTVGCGVYLADAPRGASTEGSTAPELKALVREAAALLEERGEQAYVELRTPDSKWFHDGTYFFVFTPDGIRAFHAAEPEREGRDDRGLKDVLGKPVVEMILQAAGGPSGEGWAHYMYPEPGSIFPAWKSSFVKRVTFPSGVPHVVGCGAYHLQMDESFVADVVERAAALVTERGREAFGELRKRSGPFVFMETYVFVQDTDGTELVNPAFPGLEGRNLMELRDATGKAIVREQTPAALRDGSAWLDFHWYRPGENTPARKLTYVRKVQARGETFIVGSGIYTE